MAQKVTTAKTKLSAEDVIVRSVQFFTNEKWRTQTQSSRAVTFRANVPVPRIVTGFLLLVGGIFLSFTIVLLIIGVPMVIAGFLILFSAGIRLLGSQDLVVTATQSGNGSEVIITHAYQAARSVNQFVEALPQ